MVSFGVSWQVSVSFLLLHEFSDTSEGIFVFAGSFEADSDLVGFHKLGGRQVDVAEASLCFAAPDEGIISIDFEGIAT